MVWSPEVVLGTRMVIQTHTKTHEEIQYYGFGEETKKLDKTMRSRKTRYAWKRNRDNYGKLKDTKLSL